MIIMISKKGPVAKNNVFFFPMLRTKWMKQRGMQKVKLSHIFLISDYLKVGKWGQMCLFCSVAKDICSVM